MFGILVTTVPYAPEELLRERREGAVRAVVRAVGYALGRNRKAEDVGRFLFDSDRLAGLFERHLKAHGDRNGAAFAAWHMLTRWGWCDAVVVKNDSEGFSVESAPMLLNHDQVLGFHGVTRTDMEACMDTYWRLSGLEVGLQISYTVGENQDWMLIRPMGNAMAGSTDATPPVFTAESLALHRRIALATGITCSIGYAKSTGEEPEDFGHFFYKVWERSGHYDRLRERWGFGNALAYAQNMAQSRQVLYTATELNEDLDGFTISSPSWATEIPQIMGRYGCLPDDVYRYYEGGGIPACIRLGLQYADCSTDRLHRVWIRSR